MVVADECPSNTKSFQGEFLAAGLSRYFEMIDERFKKLAFPNAGDGVHCHASDDTLLGKILVPETVANVCFGGTKHKRLFICATSSLYSIYLNTRGTSCHG